MCTAYTATVSEQHNYWQILLNTVQRKTASQIKN